MQPCKNVMTEVCNRNMVFEVLQHHQGKASEPHIK